jgi:hypothetical protein
MVNLSLEKNECGQVLVVEFAGKTSRFPVKEDRKIENFEVLDFKYYKCKVRDGYWDVQVNHVPDVPSELYPFPDVNEGVISYNDGMGHRSRYPMLLLYVKNHIFEFTGSNIPGVCVVESKDYSKNGKWSNTTYSIRLAAGVKSSALMQDWNSGRYVNDVTSLKKIAESLGVYGVQNSALEIFCKDRLPNTWVRYEEYLRNLDEIAEMEERVNYQFIKLEYNEHIIVSRKGYNRLLVNGILFEGENIPDLVQVISHESYSGHRGGGKIWRLMVPANAEIVELPEYDPYGGEDSLETRGFILQNGKWVKGEVREKENPDPESPFAFLNGLF